MPNTPTILVDDDQTVRDALALADRYDVLVARDGLEAVCVYERNIKRVAAVVTDLDMPRLNGRLLLGWWHIRPRLPVVLMSGADAGGDLEDLLRQPVISFLPKPFEPAEIYAPLGGEIHQAGEQRRPARAIHKERGAGSPRRGGGLTAG